MERGRQRRYDAGHASRRPEGDEEKADHRAGRRIDQKAWEGSSPVHPDPEKGGRRTGRKGAEFPAEYSGLPGEVQGRIGGAGQEAQIRAKGHKRKRTNSGAEPEKRPLNKVGPVRF